MFLEGSVSSQTFLHIVSVRSLFQVTGSLSLTGLNRRFNDSFSEKTRGHIDVGWGLIQKFSNLTIPPFCLRLRIKTGCLEISRSSKLSHSYSGQRQIVPLIALSERVSFLDLITKFSFLFSNHGAQEMINGLFRFTQSEPTLQQGAGPRG